MASTKKYSCCTHVAKIIFFPSLRYIPSSATIDRIHFKECLIEMLQDMFGEESVPKTFSGDTLEVQVDGKKAHVDIRNLKAVCEEDEVFQKIVQTACSKLHHSLMPAKLAEKI